jgi:CRP-like cAMP-binding protein
MSTSSQDQMQLFVDRLMKRSALSREEQDAILSLPSQSIAYDRRRDIVELDDATGSAFLVASGMVGRFAQTGSGARQYTAFYLPGDMVDLHSTVRAVGLGGVSAISDTVILRVPHAALRQVAARFPAVAEAFWRDCMLDAAVLMQWAVNVGRRDAQTRLAHLFCEMAIRSGEDRTASTSYALPLTQEHLGDAAALTSIHVNRCLKALSNLVSIKAGVVEIHDWRALARAGDFDPAYLLADTSPARPQRVLVTA